MKPSFNPGSLIRIKDYQFEDGSIRDKYLIVWFRHNQDTFIFFLNNITKVPIEAFNRYDVDIFSIVELGQLNPAELKRLLKCVLKSSFVPNDIKILLTEFKESL